MAGVQILNQTEILQTVGGYGVLIGLVVFVMITTFGIITSIMDSDYDFIFPIAIAILPSVIVGFVGEAATQRDIPTGRFQYQVTISDDVKFNEFTDKYNVIKQDGKIFTVEDKASIT